MANVKLIIDGARMEEMLRSPSGAVSRFMETRAEIVKRAAVMQCPKRTGLLSRSILKRRYEDGTYVGVIVGAYQPYALYVHEGTKAHVILPKKPGGTLHFVVGGQDVFAKKVNHPGTKANRFLSDNLNLFFT